MCVCPKDLLPFAIEDYYFPSVPEKTRIARASLGQTWAGWGGSGWGGGGGGGGVGLGWGGVNLLSELGEDFAGWLFCVCVCLSEELGLGGVSETVRAPCCSRRWGGEGVGSGRGVGGGGGRQDAELRQ